MPVGFVYRYDRSLLVFYRSGNKFEYYDSMGASNIARAREAAAKFKHALFSDGARFLVFRDRICSCDGTSVRDMVHLRRGGGRLDVPTVSFVHRTDTPHQINSFDCGMYVLALTDLLARSFATDGLPATDLSSVTPALVTAKRGELLALVRRLAARDGTAAVAGD